MSTSTTTTLPAELRLSHVHLTIANLDRSLAFYQNVPGFQLHRRSGPTPPVRAAPPACIILPCWRPRGGNWPRSFAA